MDMGDFFDNDPSLYERKPDFKGVNWNGLIFAPILHLLIIGLPHLSNYIKVRRGKRKRNQFRIWNGKLMFL